MSTAVTPATTVDASYEIKVVDGVLYVTAQVDVVKTIEDLIAKNTTNPIVKFAVSLVEALKTQLDWSGTKKDINI